MQKCKCLYFHSVSSKNKWFWFILNSYYFEIFKNNIWWNDKNNNNNSAFTIFSYMSTSIWSFFNAYIIMYMFYYSRMSKFLGVSKAWRENIFPHRQCMFITLFTSITTFYGIDIIPQNIPTFDLYEKYSMGYC